MSNEEMKPRQAFKIVNKYFWDAVRELNWDANLYDRGIIKNPRTKKASEKRKKAHKALVILHQIVEEKVKSN